MKRCLTAVLITVAFAGGCARADRASGRVVVEKVPHGGIQPQAIADTRGVIHIAYFTGDPAGGDLHYVTRTPEGTYSTPIQINSRPGSAVALATVRGVQLALGREGRVHAVWNGSLQTQSPGANGVPLYFATLDQAQQRFAAQRNLITWATGLDGGATIAADEGGGVYVAWHGDPGHKTDAERAVYLARSSDDGVTFGREEQISAPSLGACACCSMRAFMESSGTLSIVYRTAGENVNRDTTLLRSRDRGASFETLRLDPWRLEACPLTTVALAHSPRGLVAAWETQGQIRHAVLAPDATTPPQIADAPGSGQRKHPVVAVNHRGESLLAWLEDSGYARGGPVVWQVYGPDGRPTAEHGTAGKAPAWGLAAVAPLPDGRFLLIR